MRRAEKLSAIKIARLKQPGRYGDGRGLWLHIGPGGGKSWVLRFMRDGRSREMGLGPLHTVGLADARELARIARRQIIMDGVDPIEVKRAGRTAAKVAAARGISFWDAAEQYIAAHESAWRNAVHRAQWRATFATYAYPIIGDVPVADVDTALVLKVLEPIWRAIPETAIRVQQRIRRVLDWCKARGYRRGDNPAAWAGHLDKLLPKRQKLTRGHHPAMPYGAVPSFMERLCGRVGVPARALEFTILTAARTGEVIGAKWDEIDIKQGVWTVPAGRMKAGKEHRVPLCERALAILEFIPRESELVFPGGKAKQPLSTTAMAKALKRMDGNGYTVHGFRSSFRDWCFERTNYPREIVETALAHSNTDRVEAAYRRGDALDKRRRLMRDWSRFCSAAAPPARVLPLRRA